MRKRVYRMLKRMYRMRKRVHRIRKRVYHMHKRVYRMHKRMSSLKSGPFGLQLAAISLKDCMRLRYTEVVRHLQAGTRKVHMFSSRREPAVIQYSE